MCNISICRSAGSESSDTLYHISGTKYIEETLLGLTFQVSPQAFFQVNSSGAEVLYKAAIDLAEPTKDMALLDVCCGTGTIGLCFSKVLIMIIYNFLKLYYIYIHTS